MIVFNQKNHKYVYKPIKPVFLMKQDNPTGAHIIQNGIFEADIIEWCKKFCSKDKVFVDIGAHMGTYTMNLAPLSKHVFCFEAQKMTYYQLCGGIALNELTNVTAHNYALGDQRDTVELRVVSPDGGGSSVIDNIPPTENSKVLQKETVLMRPLDTFDIVDVGFMKIDVEGCELKVLKGATGTLRHSGFPPFIFEAWPDSWFDEQRKALFDYVYEIGYKIMNVPNSSNMFLAYRDD
jgi:FkbM family methyltransferase